MCCGLSGTWVVLALLFVTPDMNAWDMGWGQESGPLPGRMEGEARQPEG